MPRPEQGWWQLGRGGTKDKNVLESRGSGNRLTFGVREKEAAKALLPEQSGWWYH